MSHAYNPLFTLATQTHTRTHPSLHIIIIIMREEFTPFLKSYHIIYMPAKNDHKYKTHCGSSSGCVYAASIGIVAGYLRPTHTVQEQEHTTIKIATTYYQHGNDILQDIKIQPMVDVQELCYSYSKSANDDQGGGGKRRVCDSHKRAWCWHNF